MHTKKQNKKKPLWDFTRSLPVVPLPHVVRGPVGNQWQFLVSSELPGSGLNLLSFRHAHKASMNKSWKRIRADIPQELLRVNMGKVTSELFSLPLSATGTTYSLSCLRDIHRHPRGGAQRREFFEKENFSFAIRSFPISGDDLLDIIVGTANALLKFLRQ